MKRDPLQDFAMRAAHELVAPLVAIEAYSSAIADRLGPTDPATREDLARIRATAARSRRLVEALLESTHGDPQIERVPVELGAIVTEAAGTLEHDIADRNVRLDVGPLPTVQGDPTLLMSLVTNLLVNALRYGPRRDGHVVIGATQQAAGEWRVTVDSAGTPLAPEDRERVFGPFERGSNERRVRGTGLGLAICRDIVERHGGRIGVVPIMRGNRFWFTLPPV